MHHLPLHGVEGDVMDQAPSKAWLELNVFFFLGNTEHCTTIRTTFWVNNSVSKDQGSNWAKYWSLSLASQSLLGH